MEKVATLSSGQDGRVQMVGRPEDFRGKVKKIRQRKRPTILEGRQRRSLLCQTHSELRALGS